MAHHWTRIAELLRELADAIESADASAAQPPPPPSVSRARRQPSLVRPAGEATPIGAAAARKILREKGFR